MSSDQIRPQPEKKRPSASSFFTVMISRGLGNVRSFNISSHTLIWSFVIFALYLIFSVVVINLYFFELRSKTAQSDLLQQLQYKMDDTKQALFQAKQRLRFLEDYIYKLKGNTDEPKGDEKKPAESPGPETTKPVTEAPVARENTFEKPDKEEPPEISESSKPLLNIEGLTTKRRGGTLSVKFRLVRTKPDRRQVSGYIFIIAANSESDPPQFWTHPKAALKNGAPVNHKHGQLFKVRNYRIIRGKFFLDQKAETPSLLSILIYNETGKLILKKVFAIEKPQ